MTQKSESRGRRYAAFYAGIESLKEQAETVYRRDKLQEYIDDGGEIVFPQALVAEPGVWLLTHVTPDGCYDVKNIETGEEIDLCYAWYNDPSLELLKQWQDSKQRVEVPA